MLGSRRSEPLTPLEPTAVDEEGTDQWLILECTPLETDGRGSFVLGDGRKITLKGINVDGAMKLPAKPYMPSYAGGNSEQARNIFFEGDTVSFVGRPFPLDEAASHFLRIKSWGYNTIRYLLTWEAIEHEGPGKYDMAFIDYTIEMLNIIDQVGGLYVILEMHQDVWSRFTGGSGAPMWTLYAAGLDPKSFHKNEAAILHNEQRFQSDDDPEDYPKMLWTSNYKRLASLVMFTLFFAGKIYFPDFKLNGKNIQDYLQDHYNNCMKLLCQAVLEKAPHLLEKGMILGFELMNEPNLGLIGHEHLGSIPDSQQLRLSTCPTAYQCMKLGMGIPCEVDKYRISVTGPQKYDTQIIDPQGTRAWLSEAEASTYDSHYGWERDPNWILGECIFANVGIWSWNKEKPLEQSMPLFKRVEYGETQCELKRPYFFNEVDPKYNIVSRDDGKKPAKIDVSFFINNMFVDFYAKHKSTVRSIWPNCFVLIQAPVLEIPPNLKISRDHIVDSKTVYCPHYYDGMSLMFKNWNSKYNVDTLGIMRGKYWNPVFGMVIGERAIRNCIRRQFLEIKRECEIYLGNIPILMSETGMPFDMDEKKGFLTGRYYAQTAALDAIGYALEGSNINHTYWCYTSINSHAGGDQWNNEDFSFWSADDRNITIKPIDKKHLHRLSPRKKNYHRHQRVISNGNGGLVINSSETESETNELDGYSSLHTLISPSSSNVYYDHNKHYFPSPDGVRAIRAVIRPYVVATAGDIKTCEFDLKAVRFSLSITGKKSTKPTIIFVPKWHYPYLNLGDIWVNSGSVKYNSDLEYIEWYHQSEEANVEQEERGGLLDSVFGIKESKIIN
ncbi:uncharacterized protein KQ657_004806 [Scheffersomyces spartinae]|uniref:Uncharacterized protein n=1 Tax=Scheffersomyces spartinae TaxID=45513 RepID=A0A9P8AI75_9ASCO|nr:uncharacterized protein KQ657_004806 [Scheffersomyces spartinae]KAG7194098.1 hypothetical protein KQ657_004806 [Scheffersomyces spartinae]